MNTQYTCSIEVYRCSSAKNLPCGFAYGSCCVLTASSHTIKLRNNITTMVIRILNIVLKCIVAALLRISHVDLLTEAVVF